MSKSKYHPVDCNVYDVYEIALMHHSLLELDWLDEQGVLNHKRVKPIDLVIINKAEYLVVLAQENDPASQLSIRLDQIVSAQEKDPN